MPCEETEWNNFHENWKTKLYSFYKHYIIIRRFAPVYYINNTREIYYNVLHLISRVLPHTTPLYNLCTALNILLKIFIYFFFCWIPHLICIADIAKSYYAHDVFTSSRAQRNNCRNLKFSGKISNLQPPQCV